MKNILILFLTISLISCSKDEIEVPNYSAFLNNQTPSFSGKLNSQFINWKFGFNESQMITGFDNGNGVCSATDPVRILMFGLSSKDGLTKLNIITPKMDTSNEIEVYSVLNNGRKQFGELYNDFYFRIEKDNNCYINNSKNNDNFEILKIEEAPYYNNEKCLFVWIKIDNLILENTNKINDNIVIKDGFMIAQFIGYKFE